MRSLELTLSFGSDALPVTEHGSCVHLGMVPFHLVQDAKR